MDAPEPRTAARRSGACRALGLSERSLYRKFAEAIGNTLAHFVESLRHETLADACRSKPSPAR
jgi:transcriptional regulator GlxA family with amidase domain